MVIKTLFWVSLFIVFYTYIGYGLLIWFINRIKYFFLSAPVTNNNENFEPPVALVITAYNEEACIGQKITNTLLLNYPQEKLHIYFVTDGSDDQSPAMIEKYPRINLLHQPERHGKAAAMNRAMQFVKESFVVFSDANTMLNENAIIEMVKHYVNPKTGAVTGEKKIHQPLNAKAASAGEGIYWKYESFLKKQDSDLYSVVGAAGELFSVRKELYQPIREGIIIEDFVLSLSIAMQGYMVKYEPLAYAVETASETIREEQKRKIRICAGGFQAMLVLKGLLNIFRYRILSFQYISHRVLRWSVTPVCLFLLIPLNMLLVLRGMGFLYEVLLGAQFIFYLLAFLGWLFAKRNIRLKSLYIPYYFVFMNIAVFRGLERFLAGKQPVLWDKSAREKLS